MWEFPESMGDLHMALDISASQILVYSYTSPTHANSLLPKAAESHPKPREAIFPPSKTWSSFHMHYLAQGHHIQRVCYGKKPTKTPMWSLLSNKRKPGKPLLKCLLLEVQHLSILSTAVRDSASYLSQLEDCPYQILRFIFDFWIKSIQFLQLPPWHQF